MHQKQEMAISLHTTLSEKFDIQVDENTRNQATLLHDDIPGYDLAL